jgi:predicted RNase H-like HicB family nuclease
MKPCRTVHRNGDASAKKRSYTATFERNEHGGYTVTVPALPGLVTEGRTLRGAKAMARDAIACYIAGLLKDGERIPKEREIYYKSAWRGRSEVEVTVPARFLRVPYNGAAHPQSDEKGLEAGANCQRFVYELLRRFGFEIGPMRSSDLWADRVYTRPVRRMRAFDILLFNHARVAWGAHVALYIGNGRGVHLSKAVGRPAIWPVSEFARREPYQTLVGIKRPIRRLDARLQR